VGALRQRIAVRVCVGAAALLLAAVAARGDTYWINYDPPLDGGDEWLPEVCCGWERHFGNGGGGQPGDARWLEDGCFVIDSRADMWSWDCALKTASMNPGPQERLIVEWRLLIADSVGYGDTTVWLAGDVNEEIAFAFRGNRIYSAFEQWQYFFAPGVFHSFRVASSSVWHLGSYYLWLDGVVVHEGFWSGPTLNHSFASFGDAAYGPAGSGSLTYWDYFRFGKVRVGDVNRDGGVDFDDINPFIEALALTESEFQAQHPDWCWLAADCDDNGIVDFDDIDPLVALLSGADAMRAQP